MLGLGCGVEGGGPQDGLALRFGSFRKLGVPLKGSFKGSLKGSIRAIYRAKGLEFPKIGGACFWGPYNKDPTI